MIWPMTYVNLRYIIIYIIQALQYVTYIIKKYTGNTFYNTTCKYSSKSRIYF